MTASFEPENELERALQDLHEGRGSQERVMAVLESAEVFVPRAEATAPETLQLPLITGTDGRQAVPLFPSLARLAASSASETAYVRLPFQALSEGWPPGVDAVIDPGGPFELTLGTGPHPARPGANTVAAGTRVFVGDPAKEPEEAIEGLRSLFAGMPEVSEAYRAQVYIEAPDEVPHVAVGVRANDGADYDSLFARAGEAVTEAADGPFTFVAIGAEEDRGDPIVSHMLEQTSPFYRRD